MSMADRDGKIWMDGKLVDWRDAKIHVLTHTLHYGCGAFEGVRAYNTVERHGDLPPARAHPAPLQQRQDPAHEDPVLVRRGRRGAAHRRAREQARVVLPAAADLDRLREARRLAQGQHRAPDGRRLAVGRLPRRGGHEARHPRQDLELHAPPRQHHDDAGEGGVELHQLDPRQHGSARRRLRRGAAARRERLRQRRRGREPVHDQEGRRLHARPLGRRARRHHPQHHPRDLQRPRPEAGRKAHHARRGLHLRRGVLHRHRRRGDADPRARPHRARRRQRAGRSPRRSRARSSTSSTAAIPSTPSG